MNRTVDVRWPKNIRSGTSAKQKPRGVNPGMASGGEGPLSQTSTKKYHYKNIIYRTGLSTEILRLSGFVALKTHNKS